MTFRVLLFASATLVLSAGALAQSQSATLTLDTGAAKANSSPTLYGLMTEEINYSYDGGLYGDLVRNRAIQSGWAGPEHWGLVQRGTAQATMSVDRATGPSAALTNSLKLQATAASPASPAGLENEGYWGIPVRPHTTYQFSVYAKADTPGTGVAVSLLNDDTGKPVAEASIAGISTEWKQYSTTLTTGDLTASSHNHLLLSIAQPGTLWIDLASLFPPTYHDRKGGNRIDLMEKLAAMHPAFLRLPGGNYLEGDHLAERYEWKKTIGPMVDRPTHPSPWGYRSSDGMGLLEFLEWCEDLKIEPVLAVYGGYSMQQEHIDAGPALAPYVEDALEEIEYVSGEQSTRWGAQRAKDGHPAPFKLHYVEIGNEDQFDKSGSYEARYPQYYDAIKKRYPALQIIATTPVKSHVMDVLDDHYYKSAQEFYADVHHYDTTDRKGTKIFVGEWATREGNPTPNFGAALGDAAWMTGMERNSDVIVMASYAPLLTNVNPGALQWDTDLIGYNALSSYGSPSYYAQVMFAAHRGNQILASSLADATGKEPVRLFQSATRDGATGTVYLKLVNATTLPAIITLKADGAGKLGTSARMYTLSAPTTETTNTITDPTRLVPVEQPPQQLGSPLTLQPLSINVLEIPAGAH